MQTRIRYKRTEQPNVWVSNTLISGNGNTHVVTLYTDNVSATIITNNGGQHFGFTANNLASLKRKVKDILVGNGVSFLDETRISKKQRELMKDTSTTKASLPQQQESV